MPITPRPAINSNPLHNRPKVLLPQDEQSLWEAVQKLQADLNKLIQHLADVEIPAP